MSRVAFLIYGIGDLNGGGGAERFFADLFDKYNQQDSPAHKLYFITDKTSYLNLQKVNKLLTKKSVLFFKIFSNRFKLQSEFFQILKFIMTKRINIIHIPLYDVSYMPLLKKMDRMLFFRPKIAINIVNCYVAQVLGDANHRQNAGFKNSYYPLFTELNADGYFCWNKSFETYVKEKKVFKHEPKLIQSITSRFSDTVKFKPMEKQKLIVFASRLDEQKHADWYIDAIETIKVNHADKAKGWKFLLCGNGPLRESLMKLAAGKNLNDILEFKIEGQMEKIFNHSKIYISCQDYDNFPSLSMAEAMASGNAIIARGVGQTDLFVRHGKNGLIFAPDSSSGLTDAILKLITNETMMENMEKESVKLIEQEHNVQNFVKQADKFWSGLMN